MPYIRIRGVEHYYEWIRNPDTSLEKPVMVFLHGWGGSCRYWQTTAQALTDSFNCLLYDLRGFGRSRLPHPEATFLQMPLAADFEMESYAEDLATLLETFQLDRVCVNAHSMGASVATLFVNRYPQRVEKTILNCSGIFEYDEKAFAAFHKFSGQVVKFRPKWLQKLPLMDRLFMARFLHQPLGASVSRAFLEDFLQADYEAALGTVLTSVSQKATEVMPLAFSQLSVPVLLVVGEHDKIIPAAGGRQAAALNENVEFAVIPNTGHFPMLEDPTTYLQRIREFLGMNCFEDTAIANQTQNL